MNIFRSVIIDIELHILSIFIEIKLVFGGYKNTEMKNDVFQRGKTFQFERQHNYQCHLDKINKISRKRSSNMSSKSDKLSLHLPTFPSGYKIEQEYKVKEENVRLLKKLDQIKKRKKYEVLTPEEQYTNIVKINSLHSKYRKYERVQKQKQLQQQNQKLVEKILDKVKRKKSQEYFFRDQNEMFTLRKSRSKNKVYINLQKRIKYQDKTNQKIQDRSRFKSQGKSKLNKQNIMRRNKSVINHQSNQSSAKQQQRRRINNSTLLPTIQKVGLNKQNTKIDQVELYGMLNQFVASPKNDKQDLQVVKRQGSEGQKLRLKQQEDRYNTKKNNRQAQQGGEKLIKQKYIKQEHIKQQHIKQVKQKDIKQVKQEDIKQVKQQHNKQNKQEDIKQIEHNQKQEIRKTQINPQQQENSFPIPLQNRGITGPTPKLQKSNKNKNKRREKIQRVKQSNQYEQQKFQELQEEQP